MKKSDLLAPEKYNIVSEIEKYTSDSNKKAIIYRDNEHDNISVSYQELIKNANKVGNVFLKYGLKKGDKVLIMMPRAIATYELYIVALKLGIAIIPSSEMLRTKDLQYRIIHGEINGVIAFHLLTKEFEDVKEYDQLTKFIVAGHQDGWILLKMKRMVQVMH